MLLASAARADSTRCAAADAGATPLSADGSRRDACLAVHAARAALAQGDASTARDALARARGPLAEVSPFLQLLEGEALLQLGDARAARALARAEPGRVPTSAWLRSSWQWIAARAARIDRDDEDIVRTHRACLQDGAGDRGDLRAGLADALRRLGRSDESDAELRRLLLEDAGHAAAIEREARLHQGALTLSKREFLQRLTSLQDAARYATAAREFERVVGDASTASPLARTALDDEIEASGVEALVKAGRRQDARARVERFARPGKALIKLRAWVLGKAGEHHEAAAAWKTWTERSTDRGERAEGCFFAAFALYEADDLPAARAALEACESTAQGTPFEVPVLWYQALTAWLAEDLPEATGRLQALSDRHGAHPETQKHRYWLARARLAMAGDAGVAILAARALLTSIHEEAPTSYYGLLARRRLGLPSIEGTAVAGDAIARLAADDARARHALLLYQLGFDEAAHESAASRGRKRTDFGVSHRVDDAHRPWRFGASHLPVPTVAGDRLAGNAGWRVSYATPYGALVEASARRSGVDDAFVYAIMRTESGFDPRARSRVGALGLLQLMPYTARGIARLQGVAEPRPETLVVPSLNIELGASFLALGLREFGHEALAAAAYNGGPEQVAAWLASFGHLEAELFVERVPYRETRNYIKRVSESAALYRALRGAALQLELPTGAFGGPPTHFTWFPPSPGAAAPNPGARAPE